MRAYVHSTESFGTVDGPGLRFVVFLQGCPLRCKYCHNPDTWKNNVGNLMSVEDILKKFQSVKSFVKDGGITVTGGEPLVQIDFVTELFKECRQAGIHTCVDTSGITFTEKTRDKFDDLMKVCDLVLLDIKHIDDELHRELTGQSNKNILEFANYLNEIKKDVWIRHVLVPGVTDDENYLLKMGCFLGDLDNIKALEILPYHSMGNEKYKKLGIPLPLKGVPEATTKQAEKAKLIIIEGLKNRLREKKYGS